MDIFDTLQKVGDLEDPEYGRVYVEFGGFKNSKTILYHEGRWCFEDSAHKEYFKCNSFVEALECLINPPGADEWEENVKQQGEYSDNPDDVNR